MNGNKLIMEYIRCSSSDQKQRDHKVQRPSNLNNQKNSSAKVANIWCCIPGRTFLVVWHSYTQVNKAFVVHMSVCSVI